MFNLFKKKNSPLGIVKKLRSYYGQVVALVNSIDGPFVNLYEAGLFVSSVATTRILTFQKVDPPKFADEFNALWVEYLCGSYSVDGKSPSNLEVVSRLQEVFPTYRELFLKTINPQNKEKSHDNAVQLMWELFTNCTGKQKPGKSCNFINLVAASGELLVIGTKIIDDVQE